MPKITSLPRLLVWCCQAASGGRNLSIYELYFKTTDAVAELISKFVIWWCTAHIFVFRDATDFRPVYVSTSTTALSANSTVAVPLRTINGWILMQRKVTGGSVSFNHNWIDYRDGFGSPTQDNYWLGFDKVYRLMQLGNTRLRIEVKM